MQGHELDTRLLKVFLEELDEHVRAWNRDVLVLERHESRAPRLEHFTALLRTAHSLKGAARAVGAQPIERLCHGVEAVLQALRDGALPFTTEMCALLFATADAVEDAGVRLRAEGHLHEGPIAALLPRLEAALAGTQPGSTREPTAAAPSPPDSAAATVAEGIVRVPAERLDALLAHAGELLVAQRRMLTRRAELESVRELAAGTREHWHATERGVKALLADGRRGPVPRRIGRIRVAGEAFRVLEEGLAQIETGLRADERVLALTVGALDSDVRRARMLPFGEACIGLDRSVRDIATLSDKAVTLVIEGGAVELDRSILEGLKDPLRHLVRNAVDHGIELPAERRVAGKPVPGRVVVSAALRGAHVEVVVADDGRGLDLAALRALAIKKGHIAPTDERELARLVFEPGVSTARKITAVSGRGVGLDVVKSRLEALHGTVDVAWTDGGGTRFTLVLPLTLTTLHALLVEAGGRRFAIASTNVAGLLRIDATEVRSVQGRDVLSVAGALVPVVELADVLGIGGRDAAPARDTVPVVVITAAAGQRVAFMVDGLLSEQEVVVKSLGPRMRSVQTVSGATLLPSGEIALVLNSAHLVRAGLGRGGVRGLPRREKQAPIVKKRILLADDSVTTRTLEKSLLEAAGYDVTVAVDGESAWRLLQDLGADLLVSDVDMPRLDGFALTETVRGSTRFRELPIVLVTGCEQEGDKRRGLEVGANAYLVKSAFEQSSFLDIIAQLL